MRAPSPPHPPRRRPPARDRIGASDFINGGRARFRPTISQQIQTLHGPRCYASAPIDVQLRMITHTYPCQPLPSPNNSRCAGPRSSSPNRKSDKIGTCVTQLPMPLSR